VPRGKPAALDAAPADTSVGAGAPHEEPEVVELTDPRAIRAIAHPARLTVLDALYDQGRQLTATEAAELAGISPSAMSYHLRALERFGMVKHARPTGDARQRPWVRAARDLVIRPPASSQSKAVSSAAGAVLSVAMDIMQQRLLASLARGTPTAMGGGQMPIEAVTRFAQTKLVVTPEEAATLLREVDELIEPLRAEHRADAPPGAVQITFAIVVIPDTDLPAPPAVDERP